MGACQSQPHPGKAENQQKCKPPGWALLCMLLMGAPGVQAQINLGLVDCGRPPEPGATAAQAQAYYDSLAPHCLRKASYYRQYGQWQLQQGNPGAAIEVLERALLLEPDHLGTQLDYSQALLAVGDEESAQGMLSILRAQPDIPLHLQTLIDGQLLALQKPPATDPAPAAGLSTRTVFSQSFGADSNLNNAITATNVTLTYPDADLDLPLAKAYQPQAGGATTTVLQWTGLVPQGQHIWLLQAEGHARHTAWQTTRYQQAELHATWLQNPQAAEQWIGRADYTQLHWGGKKLYNSERLGLQRQWVHAFDATSCRTAAGLELENRRYPGSSTLDGLYRGAVVTVVCQQQGSLNFQLRTGLDQPHRAGRVGGQQRQSEARAQWQFKACGNQWVAEYSLQLQQDASGYSPLLSRNAARRIVRQALRLETSRQLDWPAFGDPQWFASADIARQASNLQAFVTSRKAVQTGLRWAWP